MFTIHFEPQKASQVIAYILHKIPDCDFLKLCMILWTCDLEAYRGWERPITTFTYIKGEQFPEPMPSQLEEAINLLDR